MDISVSTNARLSDLRPKIMRELYGDYAVYLHRKGSTLHLIHGPHDFAEIETRYGLAVAAFDPYRGRNGRWVDLGELGDDDLPITQEELYALIDNGEICALGKDCWKHK